MLKSTEKCIIVDEDIHRKLKILSATKGISIKDMVRKITEEYKDE